MGAIMMAGRGGRVKRAIRGNPNVAAARVIGKSRLRDRLWRELELREITESRSYNIGSPKMVLTVTSEPRPKERVTGGTGHISIQGVISDHISQSSMIGSNKIRGVANSAAKLDRFKRVSIVE